MLNIFLPEIPLNIDEFNSESFKCLCVEHTQGSVRIIYIRDSEKQTMDNWLKLIDEVEKTENINIRIQWSQAQRSSFSPVVFEPTHTLNFNDLVRQKPADMYSELLANSVKHKSITTVNEFTCELEPHSINSPAVTIIDAYLINFEEDRIMKKKWHKKDIKPDSQSLRKLLFICKALNPSDLEPPPREIRIYTEFVRHYHIKKKKKTDSEIADFYSGNEYKQRTEEIIRLTFDELRRILPDYNQTKFIIYDCSDPSKVKMKHDRYILFGANNSVISSSGFAFDKGVQDEAWKVVEQIPQLMTNNSTNQAELPNSTYIVPVAEEVPDISSSVRKITIIRQ